MALLTSLLAAPLGLLAYTYAGYPLLIGALARLRPAPAPAPGDFEPSVTACVPVYNGASFLAAKLDSLLAQDYPKEKLEILVFSDGSTDETEALVRSYADHHGGIQLIVSAERVGKPTALNRMVGRARGEVLLMTDARQPLAPGALGALVARLAPGDVGCVSGNLVMTGGAGAGAYWRYEKWIRRQEARFRGMVGVTGALYVVRKADVAELPADLILDDMWVPMRLRLEGKRILWCDEAEAYDQAFDDEKEFGRKVRTLAGNYQLFGLLPGQLSPFSNPSWFETVSHKVLRLACPFGMVVLLGASSAAVAAAGVSLSTAASLGASGLLAGQLGFYALALVGPRAGKLGGLARTFVVMNAAAVMGLVRHLTAAQRVTW